MQTPGNHGSGSAFPCESRAYNTAVTFSLDLSKIRFQIVTPRKVGMDVLSLGPLSIIGL
jgi:hypothetical protein